MPVVAAHRGTYFSYLTCWARAQLIWGAAVGPALAGEEGEGAAAAWREAGGKLEGLLASLNGAAGEGELLRLLGSAGSGDAGGWAPPLPDGLRGWAVASRPAGRAFRR
jgi:hypothetical protein